MSKPNVAQQSVGPGTDEAPVNKTYGVMTRISQCCWPLIFGTGWRWIIRHMGLMIWLSMGWTFSGVYAVYPASGWLRRMTCG
jgi:hypothetical protein